MKLSNLYEGQRDLSQKGAAHSSCLVQGWQKQSLRAKKTQPTTEKLLFHFKTKTSSTWQSLGACNICYWFVLETERMTLIKYRNGLLATFFTEISKSSCEVREEWSLAGKQTKTNTMEKEKIFWQSIQSFRPWEAQCWHSKRAWFCSASHPKEEGPQDSSLPTAWQFFGMICCGDWTSHARIIC